jgi:hypothetical protein
MSKKQCVLDYGRAQKLERVTEDELRAIRSELQLRLGARGKTSLAYIASVLRAAGYRVEYEDRYSEPVPPGPYAGRLEGVLEFHDLDSAERSLLKLDALYRDYRSAADPVGAKWVCALVKWGKQRAQGLAANSRVRPEKRMEKQEIARWFQVWLETPDLLADWLALRKSSDEFHALFARGGTAQE